MYRCPSKMHLRAIVCVFAKGKMTQMVHFGLLKAVSGIYQTRGRPNRSGIGKERGSYPRVDRLNFLHAVSAEETEPTDLISLPDEIDQPELLFPFTAGAASEGHVITTHK